VSSLNREDEVEYKRVVEEGQLLISLQRGMICSFCDSQIRREEVEWLHSKGGEWALGKKVFAWSFFRETFWTKGG